MNADDENKGKVDPYDEFFKRRPLWELLKKNHEQACRDAVRNGTKFPVSMGTLMVPKQYRD